MDKALVIFNGYPSRLRLPCLFVWYETRRDRKRRETLSALLCDDLVHEQWSKNTRMMVHQRIRDHRFLWCAMSWVILLSDSGSPIHLITPKEHAHLSRRVLNSFQKSSICLKLNKQVKYIPKSWKLITKLNINWMALSRAHTTPKKF